MSKNLSGYYPLGSSDIQYGIGDINTRSSNIGDENESTYLEVTNITTADIKNAIGESVYEVAELHRSDKVNKYSKFSPYINNIFSGELEFVQPVSVAAPMGDFAGYNHDAIKPVTEGTNFDAGDNLTVTVCSGKTAYFTAGYIIHLGEIDYYSLSNSISYMKLVFTNSDGTIVYGSTAELPFDGTKFTKTANGDDLIHSGSIVFSHTTTTSVQYYLNYYFYDSSDVLKFKMGSDETINFHVTYSFIPYTISTIAVESNTYFDDSAYSSWEYYDSTGLFKMLDFHVTESGTCETPQIQVYIHYPGESVWTGLEWGEDYACSGDTFQATLDKTKIDCADPIELKLWYDVTFDRPATRPY